MDKIKKIKTGLKIFLGFLIVIFFFVFFLGGYYYGKVTEGKINLQVNPDLYKETELPDMFKNGLVKKVWAILQDDYVDKEDIEEEKLFYSAMEGFVAGVGDPYTSFMDPELTKDFEDQIAGNFEGIGAEVGMKDGVLTIIAPLDGTPAKKAGLQPGDKVFAVDGEEIIGKSVDEAVHLIRGEKGTEVTLLIVRGDSEPFDVKIIRDVIELKSVAWEFRDDGLVYVAMSAFNGDTVQLFNELQKEIVAKNPKGIVLDLRGNPGGLLDVAIDIGSFWLDKKVLVLEKFGDGRKVFHETGNGSVFAKYPTVVLINQGSASGSEIIAGAFQDYGIATLVGKTTFGKGSVQSLKKLPDGSSVKVTIAKWLTPKERVINEKGIDPDEEVEVTVEDLENEIDPQLNKAVEILLSK